MASKILEMAIAIKGKLDGSLGSSMSKAVAQTQQMQRQIRAVNKDMRTLQKQMDKQQKSKGYIEYDSELQQLMLQSKLNAEAAKYDSLMGKINNKKEAAATFDRNAGQFKSAAIATAVAAAPIAAATNEAIKFESTMADVRKTVDFDTPKQFKQMSADIIALSQQLPMSAEGIAQIVAAGGQSGIARKDLMAFAQDAVKMGIAFDITADQAGEMMAKWRTAFGMSQDEVVTLADKVNYLSNVTAASSGDISDIVTRVGPLGDVAGVNAGQIAALGASMAGVGVQSEIAATGIRNLMLGLVAGEGATKTQIEAFQRLGLNAVDVAKRMQTDAVGTIVDVLARIKELPEETQAVALTDLFGKESIKAIAPLLTQLDNLKTNFQRVGDASQYAGSMDKEYIARAGTTANQINLAKNNLMAFAINIGSVLLPAVNSAMQGIAAVSGAFAKWAGENPELVSGLLMLIGALAGVTLAALGIRAAVSWWRMMRTTIDLFTASTKGAANAQTALTVRTKAATVAQSAWNKAQLIGNRLMAAPRIWAYVRALTLGRVATLAATAAQWLWNAAMSANPIGAVIIAVMALVAAGYLLYQNWETVKAFFIGLWESPIAAILAFLTGPIGLLLYIGSVIIANWDAVKAWFTLLWEDPQAAVRQFADYIMGTLGRALDWAEQKWNTLKNIFNQPLTVTVRRLFLGNDGSGGQPVGQSAKGGVFTKPYLTWVAEGRHPEVIVPISNDQNAYNLWAKAGQMLGISPSQPAPQIRAASSGSSPIYANFAPVINVNGSDNSDILGQLKELLKQQKREFMESIRRMEEEKRRLSLV